MLGLSIGLYEEILKDNRVQKIGACKQFRNSKQCYNLTSCTDTIFSIFLLCGIDHFHDHDHFISHSCKIKDDPNVCHDHE
jgi:hypothetical protein